MTREIFNGKMYVMKNFNITYYKIIVLILFSLNFSIISCTKELDRIDKHQIEVPKGYAALNFELSGFEVNEEKLASSKTDATVRINTTEKLSSTSPHKDNIGLICNVSLIPDYTYAKDIQSKISANNKTAEIKTKEIDINTKYRVYAYDKVTGKLFTSKDYIRGQEKIIGPLLVLGGKEYTVVAYSINSKNDFPAEIENANDINTATISNAQVEFMFQKQDVNVANNSNNTIKLKLKHQFSQINTIVQLDSETQKYASIRGLGGASYFQPSYSRTTFKVSNSEISSRNSDLMPLGSPVNFPFIEFNNFTTYSITSLNPTILNTPSEITDGKFTIETLTIGDVSRRVEIEDLNIQPGVKYNLVLSFNVPETTIIGANPHFHFYDTTSVGAPFTHTVELENPTFGAQLDIWYLDNSFNLNINGENLFSRELNFEGLRVNQGRHDVYFSDGTYYNDRIFGTGNIDYIFRINNGTVRQEIPVVRLTIDENGNVRLFGRKSMNQNLRDLQIRNGVTINPNARLKPREKNTLIFSSTRWTITDVEGRIYGIRIKQPTP